MGPIGKRLTHLSATQDCAGLSPVRPSNYEERMNQFGRSKTANTLEEIIRGNKNKNSLASRLLEELNLRVSLVCLSWGIGGRKQFTYKIGLIRLIRNDFIEKCNKYASEDYRSYLLNVGLARCKEAVISCESFKKLQKEKESSQEG